MLLAFGVGVLAGILLAPNSGNQTRKELSAKIDAFLKKLVILLLMNVEKLKVSLIKFDKITRV